MRDLMVLGVVLAFGYLVWLAFKPQYAFVITIRGGGARVTQGKATQAFVDAVAEIFRDQCVQRGAVRGIRIQQGMRLVFSRDVPEGCRQRIRNLWSLQR